MKTVIIAGGKGTRLGLTDIPKPMVSIGGRPLLEHLVLLAKRYGSEEIYILSGHLSEVIVNYFGNGAKWGIKVHHVIEPYPLGTAGSVKQLEHELKERFMVFYGDVVMDFDIRQFIDFDEKHEGIGTVLVHPNDHPYDSDLLEVDSSSKVMHVHSKPHDESQYYQNIVNAAIYIFSPKIFDYIEKDIPQDFGKTILNKVVMAGENLYAYRTSEYLKDMGTKDRFKKVENDFVTGKVARLNRKNKRACIFLDRDGVINPDMGNLPTVDGFKLLPGVAQAIQSINASDYINIVVTNQPMIAKGFIKENEVIEIHKKMETLLGQKHAYVDGIYYCPHHPDKGFPGEILELKIDCNCRKPKPGLLLKAANEYGIDFSRSWMVGDNEKDLIAGKAVGCRTVFINDEESEYADFRCKDLLDAIGLILEKTK